MTTPKRGRPPKSDVLERAGSVQMSLYPSDVAALDAAVRAAGLRARSEWLRLAIDSPAARRAVEQAAKKRRAER